MGTSAMVLNVFSAVATFKQNTPLGALMRGNCVVSAGEGLQNYPGVFRGLEGDQAKGFRHRSAKDRKPYSVSRI
jgi:hypothetical protein